MDLYSLSFPKVLNIYLVIPFPSFQYRNRILGKGEESRLESALLECAKGDGGGARKVLTLAEASCDSSGGARKGEARTSGPSP